MNARPDRTRPRVADRYYLAVVAAEARRLARQLRPAADRAQPRRAKTIEPYVPRPC